MIHSKYKSTFLLALLLLAPRATEAQTVPIGAAVAKPTTHESAPVWQDSAYPGLRMLVEKRDEPPMLIYAAEIDLKNPAIEVVASMAGTPQETKAATTQPIADPASAWQTTLMPVSAIAAREALVFAVNGDFFAADVRYDETGKRLPTYVAGRPGKAIGVTVVDGVVVGASQTGKARPALVLPKQGPARFESIVLAPEDARYAISGNEFLVQEGKPLHDQPPAAGWGSFRGPNPRTALGLNQDGSKLIVLVVDGRSVLSAGMNYGQLSKELVRLGAHSAINLDGGGSSAMVYAPAMGQEAKPINRPSDAKERAVANVLGVRLKNTP